MISEESKNDATQSEKGQMKRVKWHLQIYIKEKLFLTNLWADSITKESRLCSVHTQVLYQMVTPDLSEGL